MRGSSNYEAITTRKAQLAQHLSSAVHIYEPDREEVGGPDDKPMVCSIAEMVKRQLSSTIARAISYRQLIDPRTFNGSLVESFHPDTLAMVCSAMLRSQIPKRKFDVTDLSRKMLYTHANVLSRFAALRFLTEQFEARQVADMTAPSRAETCVICSAKILFESLRWARCQKGHQCGSCAFLPISPKRGPLIFATGRCALTFLAIQAPRISKKCGLCDRQYLDDRYIVEEDPVVVEGPGHGVDGLVLETSKVSLTRILYAACDVCVHCGGKYVS